MTIQRGAFVRPNTTSLGLPLGSVWLVICTDGGLKLEAVNNVAGDSRRDVVGRRFAPRVFDEVVRLNEQWVDARDAELRFGPPSFFDDVMTGRMSSHFPSPQNLPKTTLAKAHPCAVAVAEANLTNAANATAAMEGLLEATRKLEAVHEAELQAAKLAKAKADKEAAAKAKADEAKRQLSARLHADRCLAEATLELIAEVSRLNNGGEERPATTSIASHAGQLQPLAKSYGYRIVKPSMLAQVVKL